MSPMFVWSGVLFAFNSVNLWLSQGEPSIIPVSGSLLIFTAFAGRDERRAERRRKDTRP